MNKTGIEYLDYSWNPLAMHCTPVSAGCKHCWHLTMTKRLAANPAIPPDVRAAYAGDAPPLLVEERLMEPLHLKEGARIGIQLMGDLFYEGIPLAWVEQVFASILLAPQHTYLMLTKRADRMETAMTIMAQTQHLIAARYGASPRAGGHKATLPPNLWLGVTAEDQEQWDKRVPVLLRTPAAFHFVSYEPGLGAVDASRWLDFDPANGSRPALDWIIAGAETGPGARPMDVEWARSLRNQCQAAGVPFFYKKGSDGSRLLDGRMWEQYPEVRRCQYPTR